jgi:hypothetical protein
MKAKCPRCGKGEHSGPCIYTKDKKSVLESLDENVKELKEKK